jgi:RepB DNA-primase from phage plasmid
MAAADRHAPIRFLRTLFEPTDWVAIFLKSYETSTVAQRVGPVSWVQTERFQRWLLVMNAGKYNVFVSANAIVLGRRARTRDAIGAVRQTMALRFCPEWRRVETCRSRATSSTRRRINIHVFWRVRGFDNDLVERLQKQLARELQTDPAATPVTQNTRLPGFFNHKRALPHLVTVEYRNVDVTYGPEHFPPVKEAVAWSQSVRPREPPNFDVPAVERAKRYLTSVPPAIAGQHGDVHTFRVCCRLVRGFALEDDQALHALSEWNARCEPPWSPAELLDKLHRAARYGREPLGGLL